MKASVSGLLKEKNYDRLIGLAGEKRKIVRYLFSLLYDQDDLTRWRAVEAMGLVVGALAAENQEAARDIIRRLFWLLNEESGGIGWNAPQAIGEIIKNRPDLFGEYITILLSSLDDPAFTAGVLWAVGRIGGQKPELVKDAVPVILPLLGHVDPAVRGHAAWALGIIGTECEKGRLGPLKSDSALFHLYTEGEIWNKTVGEVAVEAMGK